MRKIQTLALSLALAPSSLLAQYVYHYTDSLTSIGSSWTQNGSASGTSAGLTATSSGGGSLIYNSTMPGPTGEYEVATTLTLASCTSSCGTYVSYLNASSNALSGSSPTGTFYDVELQNPTFSTGCAATLTINKKGSGGFSTLASTTTGCSNGMVIRAIHVAGSEIIVYLDNVLVLSAVDSELTSGEPGVGARGTPSGSSVALAQLGQLDTTAPNAFDSSLIGTSSFANRVDIQSPGVSDNSGGTGIAFYAIFRGGVYMATLASPEWSDTTVSAGTTYHYQLAAYDFDLNGVLSSTFTVDTPASGSIDPRRVGARPTGAYWGASPEQIDLLSGNLSYSLPLLKAQGRNGWGVGFSLSYNSENWRKDSGGTWALGRDVGFGYGWKLLAGSLTPYWSGYYTLDHWTFTDSTGAEYRLTNNSGGVWTSTESVYLSYNSNTGILYFPDGSFWNFGCESAGSEQDAGTLYPTAMEDTNGNQVLLTYADGIGVSWSNSSARITQIADVRAVNPGSGVYYTYAFTYNSDNIPHLTGISNTIGTGESYSFDYSSATLVDPFSMSSYGSTTLLTQANVLANSTNYAFGYDGPSSSSGALSEVVLPYKGYLTWTYSNITYSDSSDSRIQREVTTRSLSKDGTTGSQTHYQIYHESSTGALHVCTMIDDPGGLGEKYWAFSSSGANLGLATYYQGRSPVGGTTCSSSPASTAMTQNAFTWTQDSAGNNYIGEVDTTADLGASYQVTKETKQTVDIHGNVTEIKNYDWGISTTSTATRDYVYTYLNSSNYTSRYIFNRLSLATVTPSGLSAVTLATIGYDAYSLSTPSGSAPREWDSTYTSSVIYRGNVTSMTDVSNSTTVYYDIYGNAATTTVNGVTSAASTSSTTNFAAPDSITVGSSMTTSMTYGSFLGLTSETGPSGVTVDIGYDTSGRPGWSTSPFGATTYNVYNDSASHPNVCTSVNTRWTQTFLDGLGRALQVWTGSYSSSGPTTCSSASTATTLTRTDTTYDSCGCSPLGKMMSQTVPYAYNGTTGSATATTSYTYDGIGRTLSVTAGGSDTSGETQYVYQGNTVKVTVLAATNVVKVFTMDAFGNLTQVAEDPSGRDYISTYTYDVLNHLTSVSMPRGSVTQPRTFAYSGNYLSSATNPENGTVSYAYNGYGKVASITDQKGQEVVYTYDSYARLTEVQRYPTSGTEDTCQRVVYSYDTDSTGYSMNVWGRLASVQYMGGYMNNYPLPYCDTTFTERYNYDATTGGTVGKRLNVQRTVYPYSDSSSTTTETVNLDATFGYDNEGRMLSEQFPSWVDQYGTTNPGPNLAYTFDIMGRPSTLTEENASLNIIGAATYGPANELTAISGGAWGGETRGYNSVKQLTSLVSSAVNMQYHYPSTNNNGKIDYQIDSNLSGEQVNYTYDTLNRLIDAATTPASGVTQWSQAFTYDGFGNLDTVTGANAFSTSYDTSTNQPPICADMNGNSLSTSTLGTTGCYSSDLYAYDVANRIVTTPGGMYYSYAPGNKRVWRGRSTFDPGTGTYVAGTDEITLWSVRGQKMASYQVTFNQGCICSGGTYVAPQFYIAPTGTNYYFGGKLVKNGNGNNWVYSDRLGSVGKYYPYGQDKGSSNPSSGEKFTGYFRDSETGNDYADQRYESPGGGRFFTPDTFSGKPNDPGSWNKYAYTRGDPINRRDPGGNYDCTVGEGDYQETVDCEDYTVYDGPANPQCMLLAQAGAAGNPEATQQYEMYCMGGTGVAVTAPGTYGVAMYSIALRAARTAQSTEAQIKDSNPCDTVLGMVGMTWQQLQSTVASESFQDGTTSSATMVSLFAGSTAQNQQDALAMYGNQTIQYYLANGGAGAAAASSAGGNLVFLNYNQFGGASNSTNQAILMHEALHNFTGLTDSQLQSALGLPSGKNVSSQNITNLLSDKCVF